MPFTRAAIAVALMLGGAPAFAAPVVYECGLSRVTSGKISKVYDDKARTQPDARQRFALDVPAGRGCLMIGDACDASVGTLAVAQLETSIVATSNTRPLELTYLLAHRQFVLLMGDDTRSSRIDDCQTIDLPVKVPTY